MFPPAAAPWICVVFVPFLFLLGRQRKKRSLWYRLSQSPSSTYATKVGTHVWCGNSNSQEHEERQEKIHPETNIFDRLEITDKLKCVQHCETAFLYGGVWKSGFDIYLCKNAFGEAPNDPFVIDHWTEGISWFVFFYFDSKHKWSERSSIMRTVRSVSISSRNSMEKGK